MQEGIVFKQASEFILLLHCLNHVAILTAVRKEEMKIGIQSE